MNRASRALSVSLAVFLLLSTAFTVPAIAFFNLNQNIVSVLKLFGIGYVVRQFGPQINDAINTVTLQSDLDVREHTKVVPIISGEVSTEGVGGYIGAAQVSGPKEFVERVEAVAQIEADWQRALRIKALIPVDDINPLQMKRVSGVGVSAILDIAL